MRYLLLLFLMLACDRARTAEEPVSSGGETGGSSVEDTRPEAAPEAEPEAQLSERDPNAPDTLGQLSGSGAVVAPAPVPAPSSSPRYRLRLSADVRALPSSGQLASDDVRRYVARRMAALSRCLERQLPPPSNGPIARVRFRIDSRGTVQGLVNEDSLPDSSCAQNVVRRMRWQPGPSGGDAEFRITFIVDEVIQAP